MTRNEKAPGEGGNSKIQNTGTDNLSLSPQQVKRFVLADLRRISLLLQIERIEAATLISAIEDGICPPEFAYPIISAYASGQCIAP